MIIEPLLAGHWEDVRRIYAEGIVTGNATFETEVPTWERWDSGHLPYGRFVATEGSEVLGWAALSPVSSRCVYAGVAETSVYVGQVFRGRGVGAMLLHGLIEASEANGNWTLQAGIFPENESSVRLHKRFGFREVGRRERIGQMNGVWRDTLLFERRSGSSDRSDDCEKNKNVIRRLMEEVDRGNLDVVQECYAENYLDHNPSQIRSIAPGREGIVRAFAIFSTAFPDTRHVIEDLIAEGDRVVVRFSVTATHTGALFDVAPTGRTLTSKGIAIYRLAEGRITERWVEHGADILAQLSRQHVAASG